MTTSRSNPASRVPGQDGASGDAADGDDLRPRFRVPSADGELLPVMRLLDERLLVAEPEPPMRNASGWPVEVRTREPTGMHALSAAGANDEEKGDRLPPPELCALAPHNQYSMALTIERYAAFYKQRRLKDGTSVKVPTRLPATFVNHYLNYDPRNGSCKPQNCITE